MKNNQFISGTVFVLSSLSVPYVLHASAPAGGAGERNHVYFGTPGLQEPPSTVGITYFDIVPAEEMAAEPSDWEMVADLSKEGLIGKPRGARVVKLYAGCGIFSLARNHASEEMHPLALAISKAQMTGAKDVVKTYLTKPGIDLRHQSIFVQALAHSTLEELVALFDAGMPYFDEIFDISTLFTLVDDKSGGDYKDRFEKTKYVLNQFSATISKYSMESALNLAVNHMLPDFADLLLTAAKNHRIAVDLKNLVEHAASRAVDSRAIYIDCGAKTVAVLLKHGASIEDVNTSVDGERLKETFLKRLEEELCTSTDENSTAAASGGAAGGSHDIITE